MTRLVGSALWDLEFTRDEVSEAVSSIGPDGPVYFKGGGQAPARYLSKTDSGD